MGSFEWGGKGYKFDWIIIGENGFKKIGSDQFPTHGVFFMYKYDI